MMPRGVCACIRDGIYGKTRRSSEAQGSFWYAPVIEECYVLFPLAAVLLVGSGNTWGYTGIGHTTQARSTNLVLGWAL